MRSFLLTLVAALLLLPLQVKSQTLQDIFVTRADDLAAGKTATVKELAGLTAATREPQTKAILEAWIAGDIHFRKSDNLIAVVEETDTGLSLLDLFTGEPVAEAEPGDTKKVKNSTPIKAILRPALAALELSNPDPAARKAAAEQLAKKPNEAALNLLATALDAETDAGARTALENSLIIATLAVGDDQSVLVQLATMGNRLEPTVREARCNGWSTHPRARRRWLLPRLSGSTPSTTSST